jgi:hypothetical protein
MVTPVDRKGIEDRVRAICMALPGVTEKLSHAAPAFSVGKQFVQIWAAGHHDYAFPHLWCAARPAPKRSTPPNPTGPSGPHTSVNVAGSASVSTAGSAGDRSRGSARRRIAAWLPGGCSPLSTIQKPADPVHLNGHAATEWRPAQV